MATNEPPELNEVLALDLICLRDVDGSPLDVETHRQRLAQSIPMSQWVTLRRDGMLMAYGYLWPQGEDCWFVGGLAIHPAHRQAPTVFALGEAMTDLVQRIGAVSLRSHVLRANAASLRLHRRLGFVVEQENERGFAFIAKAADMAGRLPARMSAPPPDGAIAPR